MIVKMHSPDTNSQVLETGVRTVAEHMGPKVAQQPNGTIIRSSIRDSVRVGSGTRVGVSKDVRFPTWEGIPGRGPGRYKG